MTRVLNSLGLATLMALPGLLLGGCSDDGGAAGDKTSSASRKSSAATESTATVTTEAANTGMPAKKSEVKSESVSETKETKTEPTTGNKKEVTTETKSVKPETKSETTTEPKSGAKPEEGKVEVKAQPDEPPPSTPAAKPQANGAESDRNAVSQNGSASSPRKDASPSATAADDSAAPKFSTFASADDLANELKFLVADAEKAVADEDEYKSQVEDCFLRYGNAIALVATALGLDDEDNPVKAHAQVIVTAAHKLAEAKDFAATKAAVTEVKAAMESGTGNAEDLKWGKIATLKSLMKDEVPYVNKKLKDGLRHFKKRAKEASANAATLALIAENAKLYVAETKKPGEAAKWTEFANQLRAAAGDVAAKVHAGDEAGANAALEKVNQSCHDCHAVFNPDKGDSKE